MVKPEEGLDRKGEWQSHPGMVGAGIVARRVEGQSSTCEDCLLIKVGVPQPLRACRVIFARGAQPMCSPPSSASGQPGPASPGSKLEPVSRANRAWFRVARSDSGCPSKAVTSRCGDGDGAQQARPTAMRIAQCMRSHLLLTHQVLRNELHQASGRPDGAQQARPTAMRIAQCMRSRLLLKHQVLRNELHQASGRPERC